MARYKSYNYAQMKMVAVSYERRILPGTFEHTLDHLWAHYSDGHKGVAIEVDFAGYEADLFPVDYIVELPKYADFTVLGIGRR